MTRCPHLTTDRREDGIRGDVLGRRAREVAEINATKERPPHQTNVYEMHGEGEEEYQGYYIGIQKVDPTEQEVNAYAVQGENEAFAAMAEGYYHEMIEDGLDDDEAIERAWVMAQTRAGTGFDEHADPKEMGAPSASQQKFPPASAIPSQPFSFTKPAANDWPRNQSTSKTNANPAIALPPIQTPVPPIAKIPSVPEIDMTSSKRAPSVMRFTSEIEEMIDVEGAVHHILDDIRLSVNLTQLLALSPAMRKHLSDITKTKRVPTTNVPS